MDPKIWGPHAWIFLHCITFGYCPNSQNKDNIKKFFSNLHTILPCDMCKIHFKEHLNKCPLNDNILNSKEKLIRWLIDVRNSINDILGKPRITYNQVLLECFGNKYNKALIYILAVIIVTIIILVILKYINTSRK